MKGLSRFLAEACGREYDEHERHIKELHEIETGSEAREAIGTSVSLYNDERPHLLLGEKMPTETYFDLELGSPPSNLPRGEPAGLCGMIQPPVSTLFPPCTCPRSGVYLSGIIGFRLFAKD